MSTSYFLLALLLSQEDLLSLVARQLSNTLNVSVDRILLQWKTTDLNLTDTPAKLGISAVDILGESHGKNCGGQMTWSRKHLRYEITGGEDTNGFKMLRRTFVTLLNIGLTFVFIKNVNFCQ